MFRILTAISVFTLIYVMPVFAENLPQQKIPSIIPSPWTIIKLLWPIMLIGIIGIIFKEYIENKIKNKRYKTNITTYNIRTSFFHSIAEKNFYEEITQTAKNKFTVFSHVKLSDILFTPNNNQFDIKTNTLHTDFILCEPNNFKILLAIELDGQSHNNERTQYNDEFKNQIFKQIGVPLLRIAYSPTYPKDGIKYEIERALKMKL